MGKKLAVVGSDNCYHLGSKAYLVGNDGLYHSAKKIYKVKDGVYRLVFGGGIDIATMVIGYSAAGGMQDAGVVTMGDGKQYRLLTLTKSGTLTVPEEVQAEVWMCGGGANGTPCDGSNPQPGGAGAFTATGAVTLSGSNVATIGAGNMGESAFAGVVTPTNFTLHTTAHGSFGCGGGTGGGGSPGGVSSGGKGDGVDKHPFGDSTYFPDAHCGGGGGGSWYTSPYVQGKGGSGGTNGGNGGSSSFGSASNSGGAGGAVGGGAGGAGAYSGVNGSAATFYGSGGGGGGFVQTAAAGQGGAGYQGVIYIRIPVEQAA